MADNADPPPAPPAPPASPAAAPAAAPAPAPTPPPAAAVPSPSASASSGTPAAPTSTPPAAPTPTPTPPAQPSIGASSVAAVAPAVIASAPAYTPTPTAVPGVPSRAPAAPTRTYAPPSYAAPPAVHHLAHAPAPMRAPSTLPAQLRRLAYIVSLVLGGGAVLAGLWGAFLLPLMNATFGARAALVVAQCDRWRAIVDRLREVRSIGIFPAKAAEEEAEMLLEEAKAGGGGGALVRMNTGGELVRARTRESEKEKDARVPDSPRSASIHTTADGAEEDSEAAAAAAARVAAAVPLHADVTPLSAALRDLASSLDATATTRTSLVSTLEGYTSSLHRELFRSTTGSGSNPWAGVPGATNTSRVGLGTLSANLAKAGGGSGSGSGSGSDGVSPLGLPAARSDEWDAVRREVRAIKGMLLNRRNFVLPPRTTA